MGADGVAICASHGAWAGPNGCVTVDTPQWGPCPTPSVGKRRMGCDVTRKRRERISREEGGGPHGGPRRRVAQISRKFGLAVEGGPYPAGTHPLKACSTMGWETCSSHTICAASRMAGTCRLRRSSTTPATSRAASWALASCRRRLLPSSSRDLVRDRCRTCYPLTVAWSRRIAERSASARRGSARACCSSCTRRSCSADRAWHVACASSKSRSKS